MTEPVSSSLPTCRDLIQSIVAAVDARDVYTAHHSDRVAAMAVVYLGGLYPAGTASGPSLWAGHDRPGPPDGDE